MKYRIVQYFDYFIVEQEYRQIEYPNIICELFKLLGKEKIKWKCLDERGWWVSTLLSNPVKKYKFESGARKAIESFKLNENPKIIEVD